MIKVGIIGCGYWGPNLLRNFQEVPETQVKWVADLRKERLDFIKKRFPFLLITKDYRKILSDPEVSAVAVATPINSHFKIARDALRAGKHILVEKPMTRTVKEAQKLINSAKAAKRLLMVSHTYEYTGAVKKIKEIVDRGELGKIYFIESSRLGWELFPKGVNVVWDLAPHDLSIILSLLGKMPKSVIAAGEEHINQGVENTVYAILRFPKKIISQIHVSWLTPVKLRRFVIGGSKKSIVFDDVEPVEKVKIYDADLASVQTPDSLLKRQLTYRTGDIQVPLLDTTEPLKNECQHFIDCLLKKKKPISDGHSGLRVIKVLEAIDKSIKKGGREVKIE